MNNMTKTEKRANFIAALCIFVIAGAIVAFALINARQRENDAFDFHASLDEVAITVDSEEVTLKEAAYYILVAETNQNAAANQYNPDDPDALWNIRINYNFFRGLARKTIINCCIRDNIYYLQALEEGYELTEEQQKEIEQTALEEIRKMTDYQRELTAIEKDDMVRVLTKIQYARLYVEDLMEEGYGQEELDVDGEKYEEIAEKYETSTNDDIWNNLVIGKVTINQEN